MIEAKLKKFIKEEIESGQVPIKYFSKALTNNDDAIDIWKEFASWHREDLRELVRDQIKSILRGIEKRRK